jgi:hypothetical protein
VNRAASNGDGSSGFGMFPGPLLTELQRLGFDTAEQVIKGYLDLFGLERQPSPADPSNGQEPSFRELRVSVARALDLYGELVRRTFDGYADLLERVPRLGGLRLGAEDDAPLTPRAAMDADRASGTVWVHNTTDQPACVEFRLTDLTAHDGAVVPSRAGRFTPTAVTATPGGSVSARLEILLNGTVPGVYHGHVLAAGLPDGALPVRLVVESPS